MVGGVVSALGRATNVNSIMNVYELKAIPDQFEVLVFASNAESKMSLALLDAKSLSADWKAPEVKALRDENHRERPAADYPLLVGMTVFSRRAVDALRDLLEANGEILPLRGNEGDYFAYNVTHVINALNEGSSDLKRFKDGGVMRIDRYEFLPQLVHTATIFKIPEQRGRIYVTDKFVQRVKDLELTGFEFEHVWSPTPAEAVA